MEGIFILAEGCKGGDEELEILPPLFIYRNEGEYTEAMGEIFNELSRLPSSDDG
jgi:tRNA1(Val) A37 N6-methylase TrmN6